MLVWENLGKCENYKNSFNNRISRLTIQTYAKKLQKNFKNRYEF